MGFYTGWMGNSKTLELQEGGCRKTGAAVSKPGGGGV